VATRYHPARQLGGAITWHGIRADMRCSLAAVDRITERRLWGGVSGEHSR
jgi:hypothetical protein